MKLVLLPGMDGTGILFLPLLQCLTPFVEVQIISYPADSCLDYAQLYQQVEKELPNEPYALLAESFSGPIAIKIISSFLIQAEPLASAQQIARFIYNLDAN